MLLRISAAQPQVRRAAMALPLLAGVLAAGCASADLDTSALSAVEPATAGTAPAATVASAPATDQVLSLKPETAKLISEARSMRAKGDKAGALALLDKAEAADKDTALVKERGLLALELGQVQKAEKLLRKADDGKSPDWRLYSALGAALSAEGKQQDAQAEFAKALKLAPDHPSVLNNLALSYALDGKHEEAERLLRQAAGHKDSGAKTQQNLALIVGLKGNVEEARKISESILPPDKAKANASYLERLKTGTVAVSRAEPSPDDIIRAASVASTDGDRPIMQLGAPN